MPVVQRSAGIHACSSVSSSSVYLLPTACADTDDSVTANCHCQLSLPAVTAYCHCLLSLPTVTACCHCLLSLPAVTANRYCQLSLPAVTARCHFLLSLPAVTASCHCLLSLPAVTASCHCLLLLLLCVPRPIVWLTPLRSELRSCTSGCRREWRLESWGSRRPVVWLWSCRM